MKSKIVCLMVLLVVLLSFSVQNVDAKSLNVPIIKSFDTVQEEDTALKIVIDSNGNKGNDFSYEIINSTLRKTNNIAGSLNYYVYQGLEKNIEYKVIVRACSNSSNSYICSDWTKVSSAMLSNSTNKTTLSTPTLSKLTAQKDKSIKLTYKVSDTVTGVEIYNVTKNKKIKTKNKTSYVVKNLAYNKTYKFKIRTYLTKNNSTIYSSYTPVKSTKIKASSSEIIARTAEEIAWSRSTSRSVYHHNYSKHRKFTKWSQLGKARPTKNFQTAYDKVRKSHWKIGSSKWGYWTRVGASCDVFVGTVVRYSGYDKNFPFALGSSKSQQLGHMKSSSKWKKVSKEKRGDICYSRSHIKIYLGNGKIAEAGYYSKRFGKIYKGYCGSGYTIYRAVK